MDIIQNIIKELDAIPEINDKKEYLEQELGNPNIRESRKIAIEIMIDDNFIDNYYKFSFGDKLIHFLKSLFSK